MTSDRFSLVEKICFAWSRSFDLTKNFKENARKDMVESFYHRVEWDWFEWIDCLSETEINDDAAVCPVRIVLNGSKLSELARSSMDLEISLYFSRIIEQLFHTAADHSMTSFEHQYRPMSMKNELNTVNIEVITSSLVGIWKRAPFLSDSLIASIPSVECKRDLLLHSFTRCFRTESNNPSYTSTLVITKNWHRIDGANCPPILISV